MSKIITNNNQRNSGYIKANKSVYHPKAKAPFIKGNIYKFELDKYTGTSGENENIIYSNTENDILCAPYNLGANDEIIKFINKNFTECTKPNYTVKSVINPKQYKFCIVGEEIKEIKFDTVLYTGKMRNTVYRYETGLYVDGYSTFLGILKTPSTQNTVKEKDYILKTKVEVLKEIYGDFEVENPSSYDLVQEGFCTNGWYNRNNSACQHQYTEIFYNRGIKYLTNCDVIPNLLADSVLIENCFKTKQEAILKLLEN